MAPPRYCPRNFCNRPKEFGYSLDLEFAPLASVHKETPSTPAEKRRVLNNQAFPRLASLQHEYSIVIRRLLKSRKLTMVAYAELVNESPRRIGAILRGESVMRPDDIERAELILGGFYFLLRYLRRRRKLANCAAQMNAIQSGDW